MAKQTIFSALVSILVLATAAAAYSVDGSLSDWGVDLAQGLSGTESAWASSSPTADWIVEDNIDDKCVPNTGIYGRCYDWTGYNAKGVHIEGTGAAYSPYAEPALLHADSWGKYDGPAGGEVYDIEALYFDDISGYAFFAIVTSMPETGHTDAWGRHTDTGDLAIDLDNNPATGDYGYEYGIKTSGPNKGLVCYMPAWSLPNVADGFSSSAPSTMACNGPSSKVMGYAQLVYKDAGVADHGFPNWVIEVKVPKYMIGMPAKGDISEIHTTITCGNDVIELKPVSWDFPAPEFPSAAVPFMALIPALAYAASRRRA